MDARDKWQIKKKGYLKIHIAVNVKTKKILSMKVTDEHVHDSKALPGLVDGVIKSDSMTPISAATIGKLFADDDDEEPFVTTKKKAFIEIGKTTKEKKLKGAVTKEIFSFKIPKGKIVPGKTYQLRIRIENSQTPGNPVNFIFKLKELSKLILKD